MRTIQVDEDVGKIARYMEESLDSKNLYRVAKALSQLADLIWLRHHDPRDDFHPFGLRDEED